MRTVNVSVHESKASMNDDWAGGWSDEEPPKKGKCIRKLRDFVAADTWSDDEDFLTPKASKGVTSAKATSKSTDEFDGVMGYRRRLG